MKLIVALEKVAIRKAKNKISVRSKMILFMRTLIIKVELYKTEKWMISERLFLYFSNVQYLFALKANIVPRINDKPFDKSLFR